MLERITIKAILFDLDDTLIDHGSAIKDAAGALFGRVLPDLERISRLTQISEILADCDDVRRS